MFDFLPYIFLAMAAGAGFMMGMLYGYERGRKDTMRAYRVGSGNDEG